RRADHLSRRIDRRRRLGDGALEGDHAARLRDPARLPAARARRNLAHLRRDRPGRQLHRQLPEPVRSRDPRGVVQRAAGAPAEESDGDHRPALSRATTVPYGVCYPRVAGARPREGHMAEQVVLVEKTEGVAILTLNRPEQLNAMNAQLGAELREAVARM